MELFNCNGYMVDECNIPPFLVMTSRPDSHPHGGQLPQQGEQHGQLAPQILIRLGLTTTTLVDCSMHMANNKSSQHYNIFLRVSLTTTPLGDCSMDKMSSKSNLQHKVLTRFSWDKTREFIEE